METTAASLDTGALLAAYCNKKRIYKSGLARVMGIDYRSVFYYLKTKSMDIQKLMDFSHALNHNFLMDLAATLPASYTTDAPVNDAKDQEINRLNEKIKTLETEKEILLKVLGSRN